MWIIYEPKKVALWNKRNFEENNAVCAACLKYSVLIVLKKNIYKMQHLEGSGKPVLYIGRTVLKGYTWYSSTLDFAIRFCINFGNSKPKTSLRKSDRSTLWTAQLAKTQAGSIQIVVFCSVTIFWARNRITLRKNKLPSSSRLKLLLSLSCNVCPKRW
jgi:hypothetical protein